MRETTVSCDICKHVIPNGHSIYNLDEVEVTSATLPYSAAERRKLLDECEICYDCVHALEKAIENVIEVRGA